MPTASARPTDPRTCCWEEKRDGWSRLAVCGEPAAPGRPWWRRTGEEVQVDEKTVPHFRVANALRGRLNRDGMKRRS
jgi:hypothetical protein